MATMYKTPGAYVEEISKFPPSIAPVETAIPAFIGYTQRAHDLAPGDLRGQPRRIGSIAEYERLYGAAYKPALTAVHLDPNGFFQDADFVRQYLLYDSLRMFYANGGGDCYVVSVGDYEQVPDRQEFIDALLALERYDEPTMLVFPDAALLADNALYEIQAAALAQCERLKDRVGVFDLKLTDPKGDHFRSNSGINSLKYGMAYTPWLRTSFVKNYTFRDLQNALQRETGAGTNTYAAVALDALTADPAIGIQLDNLVKAMNDADVVQDLPLDLSTLDQQYAALRNLYLANKDAGTTFRDLVEFLFDIARTVDALVSGGAASPLQLTNPDLVNTVRLAIQSLRPAYAKLIAYDQEAGTEITGYGGLQFYGPSTLLRARQRDIDAGTAGAAPVLPAPTAPEWQQVFIVNSPPFSPPFSPPIPPISIVIDGATAAEQMDSVMDELDAIFQQIAGLVSGGVWQAVLQLEKTLNDALLVSFPQFRAIVRGIESAAAQLPPSGTVCGLFTFVDNTRGVWKAPANVSVTGGNPVQIFTASELDRLNVDVVAGKSINVIRPFTGKGVLVYGARTLAGNDNEWRYVPVRRLFNFVEESVKKATEQFVFEPNDANTWVKVQAMIENFLTTLWRQGALQGIKPEHAFYVAVGLGKTMTALDILEGRMIVEIGMAAVRPAEFIILRFSHKMPES